MTTRTIHEAYVAAGSRALTAEAAGWTVDDLGLIVTGPGIPKGTRIGVVMNGTVAYMSNRATLVDGGPISVTVHVPEEIVSH